MTTPALFPAKYTGTSSDYRLCKAQREGQETMEPVTVSVPISTVNGTIIGLVPFRVGARFNYNSVIRNNAFGTGATVQLGYIYDDNVNNTNNQTAFISTAVTVAAIGAVVPVVDANMAWKATGDGWIVLTTAGTVPANLGAISAQITMTYDQ